jgi:DNA-binding YbaB/EbfC family protein
LLIALVSFNVFTIQYSAAIAIAAVVVVGLFNKDDRISFKKIFESLAAGAQGTIAIAAACGVAGIIAGVISATGLADLLLSGVISLAGDKVIVALFLTMLCRTIAIPIVHFMDAAAEKANFRGVEIWQILAICLQGVRIAIPAAMLCMIPAEAVTTMLNSMPAWLSGGMAVGGGMVAATVNGKHELVNLEINPEAVDPDDVEMLQDMVIAAVNEAMRAADTEAANNMSRLTGGLNLGGLF